MWILIVEDEPSMRRIVSQGLKEANHTVTAARDGAEALAALAHTSFDAVLLDMLLPGIGGLDVLRRLRQQRNHVPVLVLTALDSSADVVAGLDAGADDYLVKPFAFDVLLARLRAISRRAASPPVTQLQVADLVLTPATRTVTRGGTPIALTATEFRLLEFLMRRSGRVASRSSIVEGVWGHDAEIESNTLDAYVKLVRDKVDAPPNRRLIQTLRGFGYIVREE
jgi:DNA-binding response OmpR family regulator